MSLCNRCEEKDKKINLLELAVSRKSECTGSGLIDDDHHERFIELLSATRDWICERTPINNERIVQATLDLNLFDPNENGDRERRDTV